MKKFGLIKIIAITIFTAIFTQHIHALDDFFDDFGQAEVGKAGDVFLPLLPGAASPIEVLDSLQTFQILTIAQLGLYKVTGYTSKRDVDDLPALYTTTPLRDTFQMNIFFNFTPKLFFTKNGDSLDDLTTLDGFADFIRGLDQSLLPTADIPQYLGLVRGGFAEERRFGFLFQGFHRTHNNFIVGGRLPLYYVERNWNLDPDSQKRLQELAGGNHASAAPSAQSDFIHLAVNDALGLGDLRLIGGYLLYETDRFKTVAGLDFTFPTGFAFKRGLLGSNMEDSFVPQKLNLTEIIDAALAPDFEYLINLGQNFGENALKQLGAVGLATFMGMEADPGLGIFVDQHIEAMRGVRFYGRIRAAAYFPRTKPWYFNEIKNPADFDPENFEFLTEPQAEAQIQFLQDVLLHNYFPHRFDTHFHTRYMLHALTGINFDITNNWEFFGGYDFWLLTNDRIARVTKGVTRYPLNVATAQRPNAIQNKFFGGITYTSFREAVDIEASLMFDQTFASQSIGKDTTLNVQVAWCF